MLLHTTCYYVLPSSLLYTMIIINYVNVEDTWLHSTKYPIKMGNVFHAILLNNAMPSLLFQDIVSFNVIQEGMSLAHNCMLLRVVICDGGHRSNGSFVPNQGI